jgi:hypothetical protein
VSASTPILPPDDQSGNGLTAGEQRKLLPPGVLEALIPVFLPHGCRDLLACLLEDQDATIDDVLDAIPVHGYWLKLQVMAWVSVHGSGCGFFLHRRSV